MPGPSHHKGPGDEVDVLVTSSSLTRGPYNFGAIAGKENHISEKFLRAV
jgi:hypothetical protein